MTASSVSIMVCRFMPVSPPRGCTWQSRLNPARLLFYGKTKTITRGISHWCIEGKRHVVVVGQPLVGVADGEGGVRDERFGHEGVVEVVALRAVSVHVPGRSAFFAVVLRIQDVIEAPQAERFEASGQVGVVEGAVFPIPDLS